MRPEKCYMYGFSRIEANTEIMCDRDRIPTISALQDYDLFRGACHEFVFFK